MRPLKLIAIYSLLIFILAGGALAQESGSDDIKCEDISYSAVDSIAIRYSVARPGDTVLVPFKLVNDSFVTGFQFLFQYDSTWLTPVTYIDTNCFEYDNDLNCIDFVTDTFIAFDIPVGNRFYKADTLQDQYGEDSIVLGTQFTISYALDYDNGGSIRKKDVLACNFTPGFQQIDSIAGGDDNIFYVMFEVNENMPHEQVSYFNFYEHDLYTVEYWNIDPGTGDTIGPLFPPDTTFHGCYTSQMSITWFDTTSQTEYFNTVWPQPRTGLMVFECDTSYVPGEDPVVNNFAAFPSTVTTSGQQVQLSWSVSNADSVVILQSGTRVQASTLASSSINVSLPNYTDGSTFSYQIIAYGGSKTATAYASVTVDIGGVSNNPPVISFNPSTTVYTINQGETVAFTVTATDADNDNITLTALSLPSNAGLSPSNPVIGYGTVSGNFSFTPDYNQSGAQVINFSAYDGIATATSSVVINIEQIKEDRLFSTSAPGQSPVGGLRGTEAVYFPINLVTNLESKNVYGVQFDMSYPYHLISVDSFVTTGRIPEWVVYDNIGEFPGDIRVVTFGLNNEPAVTDTTTAILYAVMTLDSAAVPWTTHWIYLDNGRESVSPDPNIGSLKLVTDSGIVEIDSLGDINLDKIIDVGDAVNAVAYIIGNYDLSRRQFATADVTINDTVNVFDLVGVINFIYNLPITPMQNVPVNSGSPASVSLAYNDIPTGSSDILTVVSEEIPERVAGVQLEISYDPSVVSLGIPKVTEDNAKFALSYKDNGNGMMKMVMYHMAPLKTGELIQPGIADLVDIPVIARKDIRSGDINQLRLSKAYLSTSSAGVIEIDGVEPIVPSSFTLHQNYPNPFNPTTSIEFSIGMPQGGIGTQNVTLDIYNILGQTVKNLVNDILPPGDYKIEWNGTNTEEQRVASGIYLYRLRVGSETDTKKMMLLK
ncbi:MAG: FlgD immunoglobulin-like domain containing protein [Candidatus Zixiibacteriota bacterium]